MIKALTFKVKSLYDEFKIVCMYKRDYNYDKFHKLRITVI